MDRLEHDLRDVLTSERRALPTDLVSLERVHAGATRRRRRRAAALGAGTALVLAAAAVPLALIVSGGDPDSSPVVDVATRGAQHTREQNPPPVATHNPSPSSTSAGGTLPSAPAWGNAAVISVTATSTRTFVALGGASACSNGTCLRLARSTDGGATFTALPVPAKVSPGGGDPTISSVLDVRFGSLDDGWLFGDALWSTHDGGQHWSHRQMPGRVMSLEAARGRVWALVTDGTDSAKVRLWTSPVGSDDWAPVKDVAATTPAALAISGTRVVVAGADSSTIWVGDNGHFTARRGPCDAPLAVRLSATTAFWATCVTGMSANVAVSTDAIRWTHVPFDPSQGAPPNSMIVGARTSNGALVDLGAAGPLTRISTSGHTRSVSRPPSGGQETTYVGFTSPNVGYVITAGQLWRTTDGGDTWSSVRIG